MDGLPNANPSIDMSSLKKAVYKRLLASFLLTGALFFLPAGSIWYWEAWLFSAVMYIPMLLMFAYLLKHDPELLARRIQFGEKKSTEKRFIAITSVYFIVLFLIPGFDDRFGWSHVPIAVVIASDIIFLLGYGLFVLVLRENSYASRIVEVVEGQQVIDSGPYSVIRHPMYVSVIIMYGFAPLALGSYWAFLCALPMPFIIMYRIIDEEQTLVKELAGYEAYRRKVKYRLIPFVW